MATMDFTTKPPMLLYLGLFYIVSILKLHICLERLATFGGKTRSRVWKLKARLTRKEGTIDVGCDRSW